MSKTITDYLPETEILAQLAEEAAELSQAALKLRRALDGTNPTPVGVEDARKNLIEECADVSLCVDLILDIMDTVKIGQIAEQKEKRWIGRLEEAAHEGVHGANGTSAPTAGRRWTEVLIIGDE